MCIKNSSRACSLPSRISSANERNQVLQTVQQVMTGKQNHQLNLPSGSDVNLEERVGETNLSFLIREFQGQAGSYDREWHKA